jgi:hypothetical protein
VQDLFGLSVAISTYTKYCCMLLGLSRSLVCYCVEAEFVFPVRLARRFSIYIQL